MEVNEGIPHREDTEIVLKMKNSGIYIKKGEGSSLVILSLYLNISVTPSPVCTFQDGLWFWFCSWLVDLWCLWDSPRCACSSLQNKMIAACSKSCSVLGLGWGRMDIWSDLQSRKVQWIVILMFLRQRRISVSSFASFTLKYRTENQIILSSNSASFSPYVPRQIT